MAANFRLTAPISSPMLMLINNLGRGGVNSDLILLGLQKVRDFGWAWTLGAPAGDCAKTLLPHACDLLGGTLIAEVEQESEYRAKLYN